MDLVTNIFAHILKNIDKTAFVQLARFAIDMLK